MLRQKQFIRIIVLAVLFLATNFSADSSLKSLITQSALAQDQPVQEEPAQEESTEIATAANNEDDMSITIGSKEYTEQLILGQMLVLLLRDAGYEVVDQTGLGGSPVVRSALETGEIDLYPELTGTALSVYYDLPSNALPTDPDRAYTLIKSLDKSKDIIWLDRGYFNNTYTMMINQTLRKEGLETLEDLAGYIQAGNADLTVCVETEFYARPQDGLHGMEKQYGFAFAPERIQVMDLDETYDGLREGECDISEGFSTDGRINAWNFHNLVDTDSFFPFYNIAPVTRQDVLERHPGLPDILNKLGRYLDNESMSALNARVDIGADGIIGSGDEEAVEDVAVDFLRQNRLFIPDPIIIGSKEYTEQLILGKILYFFLEASGYPVSDQTGTGGSPVVRRALEEGEIDLYIELTGTALSVYHNIPSIALPKDPERSYELIKSLDAPKDIVWLDRGYYNNTYTLMVKPELRESGLESIEDLALYMDENDSPYTICVESEFYARAKDGLRGMEQEYEFAFQPDKILVMDLDQNYDGLRAGNCDIAEGFSTDGRIESWNFYNLEDTRLFFPFYNPAPVTRQEVLDANPGLAEQLNQIGPYLDNQVMSALNARVDIGPDGQIGSGDEESVDDVARDFLRQAGLIKGPTLTIGSKEYTEQLILGQMYIHLLREAGYETVDMTGLGGSPLVRSALLDGEIDLYPELNGTALSVYHALASNQLPKTPENASELARTLDEPNGIAWLDAGLYNNTYTLMVQQEAVDNGLQTIEDLAELMNNEDAPLTLCVESEFFARPQDGLVGLQERYGFRFKEENILVMDLDETYEALRDGRCDVAEGFSTDGRIKAWGFYNLVDTLAYFPLYNISPVVRQDVLDQHGEIRDLLNPLGSLLDDPTMISLNALVDIGLDGILNSGDEKTPDTVAQDFLCLNGLLADCEERITRISLDTPDDENVTSVDDIDTDDIAEESDQETTQTTTPNRQPASLGVGDTEGELENESAVITLSDDSDNRVEDDVDLDEPTQNQSTNIDELFSSLNLPPLETITPPDALSGTITSSVEISPPAPTSTAAFIPVDVESSETELADTEPADNPAPDNEPDTASSISSEETVQTPSANVTIPSTYSVNARSTADLRADVLSVLPRGAIFQAIGKTVDDQWLQIILTLGEEKAWIFKEAVFWNAEDIAILPIVEPPPFTE